MKPADILNYYNIKRTKCREGIIGIAMEAKQPLTEADIKKLLSGNYNRTTFYRSFKTLVEHRIMHKIILDNQVIKYAIDYETKNKKEHAHFFCCECEKVKCLHNIPVQKYRLPTGYSISETKILIKGICVNCKKQNKK